MNRFLSLLVLTSFSTVLSAATAATDSKPASSNTTKHAMTGDAIPITIEAKSRMQDLLQAFNVLRKEKGAPKVFILLKNGEKIQQIIDITPMDAYTLAMIRYSTPQGIQLKVIGIEDIDGIMSLL